MIDGAREGAAHLAATADGTDGTAVLVTRLRGSGATGRLVGGKGAWLDRLIAAGFRVPPTAVLTTEAYRRAVAQPEIASLIEELVTTPPPPPEEHDAARARIDEAFAELRLPTEVHAALAEAAEVAAGGALMAARSSATAEDLHATSFAGQYRTLLGLRDLDDLEQAVRLVWASLWHPAPRTYRRFHGVDEQGLAMAVIVMHQVAAEHAGVAFTVDPGGAESTVRVEVVEGLGERLVSGRVTPTVHLVARSGARRDDLPGSVAALALQVEEAFGEPQDLEWASDAEGLWLLQARPVTATAPADHDGFDTADAARRRWSTAGIVEMLPGVLPPLRWDVCRLVLEESIRRHEAQAADLPEALAERPLLGRVRGRAALDADLVDALRSSTMEAVGRLASLRRDLAAARIRRRAMWEAGTACVAAAELSDLLGEISELDDDALLAMRRRVVDLGGRAMAAEVAMASSAAAAIARLEANLSRHLDPEEARAWTRRVTARVGGSMAGWPSDDLQRILDESDGELLRSLVSAPDRETALHDLATVPGGTALVGRLDAAIEKAGSAAVFAGPTWSEQPELWWAALRDLARSRVDSPRGHGRSDAAPARPPDGSDGSDRAADAPRTEQASALDELLDGLAANPDWVQMRIQTAQLLDVRRRLIRRLAEEASDLLERRERTKTAVLRIGGAVRRLHLEIGRRLVEGGILEEPADVELLGEAELVGAFSERATGRPRTSPGPSAPSAAPAAPVVPSMAVLASRRRWLARCEREGPLPEAFEGRPEHSPAPQLHGDRFQGWAASPGQMTGRACVLHHSTDPGLRRGDVLVAATTDASWAPLFMAAGAVIVEGGGPLSHAAILARELGIPAVVNLPGIVSRLEHEDRSVAVDGDEGRVTVLDRSGDGAADVGAAHDESADDESADDESADG